MAVGDSHAPRDLLYSGYELLSPNPSLSYLRSVRMSVMRSSLKRKSGFKLLALPRALGEGLDLGRPSSRSSLSKPAIAALAERFATEPPLETSPRQGNARAGSASRKTEAARPAAKGPDTRWLISALVGIALIPTAILFVLLWQRMMQLRADAPLPPAVSSTAANAPSATAIVQVAPKLEVALSSPDKIDAQAGEEIDFPVTIDATDALPSRSVLAVSAMPEGAAFSDGRPYGATGWSLRPDEIGELRLRLPQGRSGASDIRLELVTADGTVLAQSETRLNVSPAPAPVAAAPVASAPVVTAAPAPMDSVSITDSNPFAPVAQAEAPHLTVASPPKPKPVRAAKTEPPVKVNTVKTVTIAPPVPARPHDGAYALGDASDASAEWVEVANPVDMHSLPQQNSATVRVWDRGVKLRVAAREKNWVRVTDPETSASGWIYSRFLKPAEPPA